MFRRRFIAFALRNETSHYLTRGCRDAAVSAQENVRYKVKDQRIGGTFNRYRRADSTQARRTDDQGVVEMVAWLTDFCAFALRRAGISTRYAKIDSELVHKERPHLKNVRRPNSF